MYIYIYWICVNSSIHIQFSMRSVNASGGGNWIDLSAQSGEIAKEWWTFIGIYMPWLAKIYTPIMQSSNYWYQKSWTIFILLLTIHWEVPLFITGCHNEIIAIFKWDNLTFEQKITQIWSNIFARTSQITLVCNYLIF